MKASLPLATLVAALSFGSIFPGMAQAQTRPAAVPRPAGAAVAQARPATAPRPAGTAVAVVDISYIFKNHARFKQQMEEMKGQVKAFEDQLRKRHQAMAQMRDELGNYRPGTPEYKRIEEEMARLQSQLQVDTQLKRKEFLEREAKVYFNVYTEISNEIAYFAERHGISLVLRFSSDKIDPQDRRKVLEGVNRAVVYQKNLNITMDVLDRLNRMPSPGVAGRPSPHQQIPR